MNVSRHTLLRIIMWTCLLIAIVFAVIYFVLWQYNSKAGNPLPFQSLLQLNQNLVNEDAPVTVDQSINIAV